MSAEAVHAGEQFHIRRYIVRHLRGEFSLPQSFWLNGFLTIVPFNLYFRIMGSALARSEDSFTFLWFSIPLSLMLPIAVWAGVGIWRSAGNRMRAGKSGWAFVARLVVLMNAVVLASAVFVNGRAAWSSIAAYRELRTARFEAFIEKDRVIFTGEITPSSADALTALLKKQQIQRLVLRESLGGLIFPALRLADVVHDRHLTVVVSGECDSACTILLAAGSDRFAAPTSVIRLHSASIVGTPFAAKHQADADAWYVRAGASEEFLAKVHAHLGRRDFYSPTLAELAANGLITHFFDLQAHLYEPAKEWCQINVATCSKTGLQNAIEAAKRKSS